MLSRLVAACARHYRLVVLLGALLAAGSIGAAARYLGVTTDTSHLFSPSLPWKHRSNQLIAAFPQDDGLLVAVIDAQIPEEAEATAAALAAAMRADPRHFTLVRQPDALPYLQRNAFLLIDRNQLADTLNQIEDAQPFLGQLVADPSLRGLFGALSLVAEGVARGQADLGALAPAMAGFHQALAAAAAGHPAPLSWENLLAGKLAAQAGKFRFVTTRPVQNFGSTQPGGEASAALRADAAKLEFVRDGSARVRLTGDVALSDEEFASAAQGAAYGLIGSLLLVTLWLFLAVRSWRLMVPIVATLLLGLIATTGFAALAVGTLNLISVAFAILFVGIAVDFAIQFSVRVREHLADTGGIADALAGAGRDAGPPILIAALATACGFLAFTPTAFIGVAQLGLIAGFGMIAAFVCTLTFLPAMLAWCGPDAALAEGGFGWAAPLDPWVMRQRWWIVGGFAVLGAAGVVATTRLNFEGDPLRTKNQHTEAVRTLDEVMREPMGNPYTVEAILPSLDAAIARAARLSKLPSVQAVLTLASFVPADQTAKLAMLADANNLLATTLAPPANPRAVDAASLRQAAAGLAAKLGPVLGKLPPEHTLRAIAGDAATLAGAPDATLMAADAALTRFLPAQLDRLRSALAAGPVTLADVPEDLRQDWLLPDGRAKIQVIPKFAMSQGQKLHAFLAQVGRVLPEESGPASLIVHSADTITRSFVIAAAAALLSIAAMLGLALRALAEVALVLIPLVLSALLTVLLLVSFGETLNFANIIALPLLLGVGVSFNIYFVMNWRDGQRSMLGSATARGVAFSALTTATAFGSLALSAHPGSASMGDLLLISLGCTVVTTLLFVPALLSAWPRR